MVLQERNERNTFLDDAREVSGKTWALCAVGAVMVIAAAFGISYAAYMTEDGSGYTPSSGTQSCRTMNTDGPCTSDTGLQVDSSSGYQEGVELAHELARELGY